MVDLMYEVSKIAQGMIFGKLHGFTRKTFYDENRKKEWQTFQVTIFIWSSDNYTKISVNGRFDVFFCFISFAYYQFIPGNLLYYCSVWNNCYQDNNI